MQSLLIKCLIPENLGIQKSKKTKIAIVIQVINNFITPGLSTYKLATLSYLTKIEGEM